MPVGGTRAELIAATLPGLVLADLVHTNSGMTGPIRQAIAELPQASLQIKNVGGHEVRTCADLYRALDALANNDGVVQVDFVEPNASASSPGFAVALDANSLRTIGREVAPESGAIRAVQGGNPCIVMRTNDCTCTVAARVERQLGLLQVVATINAGSDCNLPLPLDIRAWCDGVALRCLTSAESLNLLYGDRSLQNGTADDAACSFSAVSDREDYLLPTNFKRLSESLAGKQGPAQVPSEPALVSVPGADYPGSPILADARALAGFLLRRQIYQANSETTGWVIFGANQIRNGDSVEIAIDLGAGPERFKFRIPAEPARAR
jgi:hypothetical protein